MFELKTRHRFLRFVGVVHACNHVSDKVERIIHKFFLMAIYGVCLFIIIF